MALEHASESAASIAVPGFVPALRFRIVDPAAEDAPRQGYMALYTMRTDEPQRLLDTLSELVEFGRMNMTDALDQENLVTILHEAISTVVTSGA